ncbi:MAG: hypothetical protein ACREDR_15645 [Blastocatellia bacterium]
MSSTQVLGRPALFLVVANPALLGALIELLAAASGVGLPTASGCNAAL